MACRVLGIPFSIVPAANWHMLPEGRESLFWHSVTPSNSLLLTWRNALLLRDTNMPVTVQAELFPDGAARLRYDLSGLADASALTDAAAMIWRDGAVETVLWDIAATNAPMRGAPMLRSGSGCGCGCVSVVEGGTNEIAHASSCGCGECVVSGTYSYEGFGLPFELRFAGATGGGGTEPDPGEPPDPDPPPPPPNPPSVSVSFDTDVVIFEDGYEDSPGVFKPRHSTTTKLTVTANGGDTGASLDLTIVGGLEKCAGRVKCQRMLRRTRHSNGMQTTIAFPQTQAKAERSLQ